MKKYLVIVQYVSLTHTFIPYSEEKELSKGEIREFCVDLRSKNDVTSVMCHYLKGGREVIVTVLSRFVD